MWPLIVHLEPQHVSIEVDGLIQVGDIKGDMLDAGDHATPMIPGVCVVLTGRLSGQLIGRHSEQPTRVSIRN